MILRGRLSRCKRCRSTKLTGWVTLWDRDDLDEDGIPACLGTQRRCKACGHIEHKA